MPFPDRRTTEVLLTTLLFAVVLSLVYVARYVIVIFIFAILFAYLIDPVVRFLQRHSLFFRNLRGPHVAEVYLLFLVLIALGAHAVAPGFLHNNAKLFRQYRTLWTGWQRVKSLRTWVPGMAGARSRPCG